MNTRRAHSIARGQIALQTSGGFVKEGSEAQKNV